MLNYKQIIKRGYVTEEEYEEIFKANKLEKLTLKTDWGVEGIWVFPLEDSNTPDKKFRFVFFNDPLCSWGSPRPVAGLVGVAVSKGKETRAVADYKKCVTLFEKVHKEALAYHNSIQKK